MIGFLLFLVLVFLAALGFVWLAEHPGDVMLSWQGYQIETSVMAAMVALALTVVVLVLLVLILRALFTAPRRMSAAMERKRREKGFMALSRGMVAVGAGDARAARKAAGDARRLLGADQPLVMLLAAQAAQVGDDRDAARVAFERLADRDETKLLGLHGLFVEAQRQGEPAAALHFAEEAHRIAAQTPWACQALFDYRSRSGDWNGALAALAGNEASGLVTKDEARRLRAVLLTGKALELETGQPDEARVAAVEANRLVPELVPAAVAAARLLARANDMRKAAKVLETAWRATPHPEIAEAYADLRPGDTNGDRLKRMQTLAAVHPASRESAIALGRVAIEARDWKLARARLEPLSRNAPSARVCLLMADLEEGENGDTGRSRAWLARALYAPADPVWTADGKAYERWAAVSPTTGRVDAFAWKVIDMPALPPREIDLDPPRPAPVIAAPDRGNGAGADEDDEEEERAMPIPDDPGPSDEDEVEEGRPRPAPAT